jgi:hypothetical protein
MVYMVYNCVYYCMLYVYIHIAYHTPPHHRGHVGNKDKALLFERFIHPHTLCDIIIGVVSVVSQYMVYNCVYYCDTSQHPVYMT